LSKGWNNVSWKHHEKSSSDEGCSGQVRRQQGRNQICCQKRNQGSAGEGSGQAGREGCSARARKSGGKTGRQIGRHKSSGCARG
jgi:hypothetical protein